MTEFHVGDKVEKTSGYYYPGVIVSKFNKLDGQVRYVVEFYNSHSIAGLGMLHIFSGKQLRLQEDD